MRRMVRTYKNYEALSRATAGFFAQQAERRLKQRDRFSVVLSEDIPYFPAENKGIATRVASGKILNALTPKLPMLIGGSADLNPSTHTALEGGGDFENPRFLPEDRQGSSGGEWGYGGGNLHTGAVTSWQTQPGASPM